MTLPWAPDTPQRLSQHLDAYLLSLPEQTRTLWAKSGDDSGWANLPQHLADTAGVIAELWDNWLAESVKERLTDLTGLNRQALRTLTIWLAGVHDIGKATVSFQRLIENTANGRIILNALQDTGLSLNKSMAEKRLDRLPHGLAGEVIVSKWLQSRSVPPATAWSISAVVGAHHGIATSAEERRKVRRAINSYTGDWSTMQQQLLDKMATATGVEEALLKIPAPLPVPATQPLTGLLIMADWIASNQAAFPLLPTSNNQGDRIRAGLEHLELTGPWSTSLPDGQEIDARFQEAFGWPEGYTARPIQRAAVDAAMELDGPGLIIVEAPTGEGKTEAALAAGHIIVARTRAQGLLLAAPTMGTANGLFNRVLDWSQRNTREQEVTSMNLVHSKKDLSEPFEKLHFTGIGEDNRQAQGTVIASQWFQGTKKGMLSNFVVATVDQVLMMALQMRHSMLRHLGLAGKVIIIDEVHSYDLYMSSYLTTALKWLARYHVSVILLSATLPVDKKHELVEAYAAEFVEDIPAELSTGYPLITTVGSHGVREITTEARPTDMTAHLKVIPDSHEVLAELVEELVHEGGCLLIICNTIRRAQEAYRLLEPRYPGDVDLHHSAFIAAERADKEDRLITALGPGSHRGQGRPDRAIIIATQVAEQSLDIDADALITDIAPMDLLIQRIGRIHRHARPVSDRPARLRQAQVYIRGIEQQSPVPVFEGGSAAVYEPALLLATMANLPTEFRRPDDVSTLVQNTYDPGLAAPAGWQRSWDDARSVMRANCDRSDHRAKTYQIPAPEHAENLHRLFERYHRAMESVPTGEEAGTAQVRDADPVIEAIPIVSTDYGYRLLPLATRHATDIDFVESEEPSKEIARHLASSTVRLPARFSRYEKDFERTVTQLERGTPVGWSRNFLLRGKVALCLNENHETVLNGRRLRYSSTFGLEEIREEQ